MMANKAEAKAHSNDPGVGGPVPMATAPAPAGKPSFFQTLPGILTATAAVITAVGGLVVGLHEPKPAADKQLVAQTTSGSAGSGSVAAATGPRATPAVASPVGARSAVVLSAAGAPAVTASLNQVKVGNTVVKILSARLDPASQNSFDLRLATRVTNEATYAGYWGSNCCRLIIDDVPRAPSDFKPLTVEAQAAMDGEMTFSVPNGTTEADLRLIAGDKDTRIHLQFAAPK